MSIDREAADIRARDGVAGQGAGVEVEGVVVVEGWRCGRMRGVEVEGVGIQTCAGEGMRIGDGVGAGGGERDGPTKKRNV